MRRLSLDEVQKRLQNKGFKLYYEEYTVLNDIHLVQCINCDSIYEMILSRVIDGRNTCKKCPKRINSISIESMQNRLDKLFGNKEFILQKDYKGSTIECNIKHKCGNTLYCKPIDLERFNNSCSHCVKEKQVPARIYLLKFIINELPLYKLGVTSRTIKTRYKDERLNYDIVWEISVETLAKAIELEKKLIAKYESKLLNTGELYSGNTETFSACINQEDELIQEILYGTN